MSKRLGEKSITIEYLPGGIDIQGGAELLCQRTERDALAMQFRFAPGIVEGTAGVCGLVCQKQGASREWIG
jgi:hypothetical protein